MDRKVVKLVDRHVVAIVVMEVSQTRVWVGQSNWWLGGIDKLVDRYGH